MGGGARPMQWIPAALAGTGSDPLKDIQAQVLAMEAGITSRRKVVEATGYDIEEVDRENAADAARATGLGLRYRTSPGETQGRPRDNQRRGARPRRWRRQRHGRRADGDRSGHRTGVTTWQAGMRSAPGGPERPRGSGDL